MLTAEISHKYKIDGCYDLIASIDWLYSETEFDPDIIARMDAMEQGWLNDRNGKEMPYDTVPAISADGKLVMQVIVFKDYEGYTLYLADGVTVFDDRGR